MSTIIFYYEIHHFSRIELWFIMALYKQKDCMAGHSKWNNIKNRKGAVDAKKSKEFAQAAKMIRIAVKEGASDDPKSNPGLRLALDKARAVNMPKDKITKAIERGMGKTASGQTVQELLYEGFGPHGVGVLVEAITDNPNRTVAELKFIFSKNGGNLSGAGSAQFLFEVQGKGSDRQYVAKMPVELEEAQQTDIERLIDALKENEDVEEVFTTAVITRETQEE